MTFLTVVLLSLTFSEALPMQS